LREIFCTPSRDAAVQVGSSSYKWMLRIGFPNSSFQIQANGLLPPISGMFINTDEHGRKKMNTDHGIGAYL